MAYKPLFFTCACFIIANSSLPAQPTTDEHKILIETIYELLNNGYSADDVVAIIGNDTLYTQQLQKIVLHIQSSIANQHTQHEITSNQAINKELAIFFAMKNFKMRMKLYAPLIEALTMIIFVIVIGYLIYKWLPSFPWPGLRRKANKAQPPDGSPTSPKAPDHINLTANQHSNNATLPSQQPTTRQEPNTTLGFNTIVALYDQPLNAELTKQIEYAKANGLEPTALQQSAFDALENNIPTEPRGNRKFKELIDQQIAYARSIGLEPTPLPLSAYDAH